jgi:hypothetical protein
MALMFSSALAVPLPATGAELPSFLQLRIWFDSSNCTVEMPTSGPAVFNVTGHFSTDKLPMDRGSLSLWATIDSGWPFVLSPDSAIITSPDPQPFNVRLIIPQGTPANISGTLKVFGRYCHWSSLVNGTTVINVGPHYGVQVALGRPVQPAGPGMPPLFEAVVTNTGNAMDTFYCAWKEPGIATMRRWSYSPNRSFLEDMAPGESRTIALAADLTNAGIPPVDGAWSEVFFVQSMNARARNQTVGQDVRLTIHTRPGWWEKVDVPTAAGILWAAAVCAITASAVRTRKRQGSRRRPALKEIGKDGGL